MSSRYVIIEKRRKGPLVVKWKYRKDECFIPYLKLQYSNYIANRFNPLVSEVLAQRDLDYEDTIKLLKQPQSLLEEPEKLVGCHDVANAIVKAVDTKKDIYIFADYDVDGLTSGYVMATFLHSLGVKPSIHYPERKEGYGLSLSYVQKLPENSVVITVDNGITAIDAVDYCNQHKIQVIVTDHHEPKDKLPQCVICDPFLELKGYGHHLCGAAVAWKVCQRVQKIMGKGETENLLPYVAIGTISDVMPMVLENQAIVRMGLDMISEKNTPNLWELMQAYKLHDISVADIAWKIAPLLNACSRLGNVRLAAQLLFYRGDIQGLRKLITEIDALNERRKRETVKATEELRIHDYSQDQVCIFDASEYAPGIAGIIANKLMDMHNKPAIVYVKNGGPYYSSSSRSPINLLPFLEKEKQLGHIVDYGGHANACGITLLQDVDTLQQSLNQQLASCDYVIEEPELLIDAEITFSDLTKQNYIQLNKIPTDKVTFPEAKFIMKNVKVAGVKVSGNNPNNIQLTLVDRNKELKVLWVWGFGERYRQMGSPQNIDLVGSMAWGFGNSNDRVTFNVEDVKPCS